MGRNLTFSMQIVQDNQTSFKQGVTCLDKLLALQILHI
jgi:hypothetical protein